MLKIAADENIALAHEAFSSLGEVFLFPGRRISNKFLKDKDILLVRSVTRVDKEMLDNTGIKFVGTATIGTDHIDIPYLKKNHITFADAKGCNANAVAEYLFSALFTFAAESGINLKGLTIGIIGAGNIGSRTARIATAAGMKVLLNDPPLKRTTGYNIYSELDEVLQADIISLHVPLSYEGSDKTYHLIDEHKINLLKEGCILINTSRGEVIDNYALVASAEKKLTAILDVWEFEPDILTDLLQHTRIATPHIAGFSLEGKINGTVMLYKSLCRFLEVTPFWKPHYPSVENQLLRIKSDRNQEESMNELLSSIYNIRKDDEAMRRITGQENQGEYFDFLRKEYPLRREFCNYSVNNAPAELKSILSALRFNLPD